MDPIGLPPTTSGQSYDMYSVSEAPNAHPAIPPIRLHIRTGLTGWSRTSSSSGRGTGEYTVRLGSAPASDTTMITKRSNHIPTLTKMEMTNSPVMLVRIFLNHSSCGRNALQIIIVHVAHQNGPKARYQNAARSWALPPNQATKYSHRYA